jgi:ubiquinone/menaquinone biosynthesis C-methylase UbiE
VRGCKRILDAACGNGRYSKFLLRHADPDAVLTSFDLSAQMLRRARSRLRSDRVTHAVADLTRLPYADATFDAVVCGWVLEHLPDPRPGLRELARVLCPGGKLLLLSTEDTFTGAMCSRLWHCRTYNRGELRRVCAECGLRWQREMWFSPLHRALKLGGIIVELRRMDEGNAA